MAAGKVILFHLLATRSARLFSSLPVLISVSAILYGWGVYSSICLLYLLFDGLHHMVSDYRNPQYDTLLGMPTKYSLKVGSIVGVDKKFNGCNSVLCLVIGLIKGIVSIVQIYLAPNELIHFIYGASLISSCLTYLSEILMVVIIANAWEGKYLSKVCGIDFELALQEQPGCHMARYAFVVTRNPYLQTTQSS